MSKLAINGGTPVSSGPWVGTAWPPVEEKPGFTAALTEVIESGVWGIGGEQSASFIEEFAAFCDARRVVLCTNGTAAIEIALRAAGAGPGDEVIVPPYTFIATASACVSANAVPVFADIDPCSLTLDPRAVEAAITPRTKAVIGVLVGGMPCDMDALNAVCAKHGLALIEDAAQAVGAVYRGKRVGALGTAGTFSFQSSKNLTSGEGGAVVTNDETIFQSAWSFHNCGRVTGGAWYDHRILGTNMRITEFQAAILRHGLTRLPDQMDRRDACAMRLRELLADVPGLQVQGFPDGAERCAWHIFIVRYDKEAFAGVERAKLLDALRAEGIPVSAGYNPLYREPAFADNVDYEMLPWNSGIYSGSVRYEQDFERCPVAEAVASDAIWLFQSLLLGPVEQMDAVAEAFAKVQKHADEIA